MIPQSFIDDIQARTDIAELIGSYIPLKRAGRNFKGLCPFHSEKTSSFMVSPNKQIYHCFGCGEGGGALQFIMQYEKVSFVEAIEMLAKRLGVEVPAQKGESFDKKNLLFEAINEAVNFYHKALLESKNAPVLEYLKNRGITKEIIEQFRIGYAPGYNSLIDHLRKKNYTLSILEKASLAMSYQDGNYRDLFVDRVMFPIFDTRSRAVGFGGRIWKAIKDAPKYINSLENPVYSKRSQFFGINFSRDEILKSDNAVIVEGYLDMIIPFSYGIKNIVASSGTALTIEQIQLLRRYTLNITLLFDADKAGQMATLRAIDLLLENEMNPRIVQLPQGHDPDTLVRAQGKEGFLKLLENSRDFFDYKMGVLRGTNDIDSIDGKSRITKEIFVSLVKLKSEVQRYEYIKRLSRDINVREEILLAEFSKVAPQNRRAYEQSVSHIDDELMPITEKVLLKFMLTNDRAFEIAKKNLSPLDFTGNKSKKMAGYLLENYKPSAGIAQFIDSLQDKDISGFVSRIMLDEDIPLDKEVFKSSLMKIKANRLKEAKSKLRDEIKAAEKSGDSQKIKVLINQYATIKSEETK
jgi:DNA primase